MEKNDRCRLSVVLKEEDILLETVYNSDSRETFFVRCYNGSVDGVEDYTDAKGVKYLPYPADDVLIEKGFIKLPSAVVANVGIQKLFDEIKGFLAEFVKIPESFLVISSLYVIMTWVYDRFQTLPYLRALGDWGTGKSRFREVIENICYKSISSSSISASAVFRVADLVKGTVVLDEANFKTSEMWSEMIKVLNSGHSKGSPVCRMNVNKKDGKMEPEVFEVFGPKVIASRERFSDEALESRCLTQIFLPYKKTDKPIHLPPDFKERAENLRNKLLAFRLESYFDITANESTVENIEFPRLKQGALAITTIASMVSTDVLQKAQEYFKFYEAEILENQRRDIKVDILLCILDLIGVEIKETDRKEKKMYMKDIKERYGNSNDDYTQSDHKSYTKGKQSEGEVWVYPVNVISARKVGVLVRNLGIRTLRDSGGFYIPISVEIHTIETLAERYGLELPWLDPKQQKIDVEDKVTEDALKDIGDLVF